MMVLSQLIMKSRRRSQEKLERVRPNNQRRELPDHLKPVKVKREQVKRSRRNNKKKMMMRRGAMRERSKMIKMRMMIKNELV